MTVAVRHLWYILLWEYFDSDKCTQHVVGQMQLLLLLFYDHLPTHPRAIYTVTHTGN